MQKYDWPNEIPDEEIREQFTRSAEVRFSARTFNHIPYRSIAFGNLGWWLPLARVLPLIGITPQMLRSVFNPHRVVEKKMKRVRAGKSNRHGGEADYQVKEFELPDPVRTYEQLGGFPLSHKPFQELARVLGKSVEVLREDGGTGDHRLLFTARPSGEIVEPANA